jgi:ATP-dependent helicase/nuclease subunit A
MTRAIDRLIVCGFEGQQKRPEDCWYDLVCGALSPLAVKETGDDGEEVLRFRKPGPQSAKAEQTMVPAAKEAVLPEWLQRDAPIQPLRAGSIMPSDAVEHAPTRMWRGDDHKALARGRLVHRLMQSLPDIPPEQRAEAARRHFARAGRDFTPDECALVAAEVGAVLNHSPLAPLFAPGSRAEVPIVGRITRAGAPPLVVSGQVDRLAVTSDAVMIADYKTNRPAPRRLEEVPQGYITQLALYRAILALLYPGRTVRAALVWTEAPDLMEIPASVLDRALAQFSCA